MRVVHDEGGVADVAAAYRRPVPAKPCACRRGVRRAGGRHEMARSLGKAGVCTMVAAASSRSHHASARRVVTLQLSGKTTVSRQCIDEYRLNPSL